MSLTISRSLKSILLSAACILSLHVPAPSQTKSDIIICGKIGDDKARLTCFDRIYSKSDETTFDVKNILDRRDELIGKKINISAFASNAGARMYIFQSKNEMWLQATVEFGEFNKVNISSLNAKCPTTCNVHIIGAIRKRPDWFVIQAESLEVIL